MIQFHLIGPKIPSSKSCVQSSAARNTFYFYFGELWHPILYRHHAMIIISAGLKLTESIPFESICNVKLGGAFRCISEFIYLSLHEQLSTYCIHKAEMTKINTSEKITIVSSCWTTQMFVCLFIYFYCYICFLRDCFLRSLRTATCSSSCAYVRVRVLTNARGGVRKPPPRVFLHTVRNLQELVWTITEFRLNTLVLCDVESPNLKLTHFRRCNQTTSIFKEKKNQP